MLMCNFTKRLISVARDSKQGLKTTLPMSGYGNTNKIISIINHDGLLKWSACLNRVGFFKRYAASG